MKKEDEELLARVAKEEAKHGLELEPDTDDASLHKIVKRLIDLPPTPKPERLRKKDQKGGGRKR